MAKEHGMMEHKGKTIPREVKSLADRIRKEQPDKDDEYAYRTAWDIFRSHTPEGKAYPHKSPESGLAREGGGTGPINKEGSPNWALDWAYEPFWFGFMKEAAIKIPKFLSKMPKLPEASGAPLGVPRMTQMSAPVNKAIKPATDPLNYNQMNAITRAPAGTMHYDARGARSYSPPPKA